MKFLQNNLAHYRTLFSQHSWQQEGGTLPTPIADWLLHTDSLTQKLQRQCQRLSVQITAEGWQQRGKISEFFANTPSEKVWVREVVLYCDGLPCIFAQTLLPEETVEKVAKAVLTLGDTPIGLWLFPQHPQRLNLEWRQDEKTGLYARRSPLLLKGYPLAIYELFLPQFPFETACRKA